MADVQPVEALLARQVLQHRAHTLDVQATGLLAVVPREQAARGGERVHLLEQLM